MRAESIKKAKELFLAGGLENVSGLIDYLQAKGAETFTLNGLGIELPVGISPTKTPLEELVYLSKGFSFFSQEELNAFDQSCRAAAASLQA